MVFCKATPFSWTHTISTFLHVPQPLSGFETKRLRVWCGSDQNKKDQMIISITGATGFVGRRLVQRLSTDNHNVRVLTRSRSKAELIFPVKDFPGIVIAEEPEWKGCIQGSHGVVNLAGMPISTRWSSEIKKEIKQSRIRVTSKIVGLINDTPDTVRPKVLVSATAVGYYGTSETQIFDEQSPSGNDYLAEVCREWEAEALKVNKDVRLALIRIGVVLGKDGGALAKMVPLFKVFAGGPLGSGNQWFSWIHLDDIVNLIYEALSNPSYKGVINGTAPNPVRLAEMCEHLGNVLGRPSWLPVPDFALKAVLGEGATVVRIFSILLHSFCISHFAKMLVFYQCRFLTGKGFFQLEQRS
nr:epimerase family protein SDR39U1 homolog, chloroplastic isoform X1 [Ziziphus jujuba var. spinosa]XP_048337498.1 epimerase family protein SDR39U1 homolog, chloroplastic isoform X1 [Ziziphus jujuba var. spinosa]